VLQWGWELELESRLEWGQDSELEPVLEWGWEPEPEPESRSPTIDIRTDAGWVQIVNDDKEAFQRDYERIVELMPELFIVAEIE
jgi:hypothetical protein